jgi:hypothetical protein
MGFCFQTKMKRIGSLIFIKKRQNAHMRRQLSYLNIYKIKNEA